MKISHFLLDLWRDEVLQKATVIIRNDMMKTPMDKSVANKKYIEFREYLNKDEDALIVTKLVHLTTLFTIIIKTQLMIFNCTWKYYQVSTQILEKIVTKCINTTNKIQS